MDPHNPIIEKPELAKLCKDCKHYRPFTQRVLFWKFKSAELARCEALPDLVTGAPGSFCSVQRGYSHTECGKTGKLWERA